MRIHLRDGILRMRTLARLGAAGKFTTIVDELMKTFEGRQEDGGEEEPADVTGLLALHIGAIHTVREDNIESSMAGLLQLRVSFRENSKLFSFSEGTRDSKSLECGLTQHLSIQLDKECGSVDKWLSMELIIQSPLLPQERDAVLAKALLDIHTIIHDSPLVGEVELKEPSGDVFAVLSTEIAFCYGIFGFGESFQLQHPFKRPGHFLHNSMFPRLSPPESRTDANCILLPLPQHHPTFIPFHQKAALCGHESPVATESFQPKQLASRMSRLSSLHAEYGKIKDRQQKLAFLEEVVARQSAHHSDIQVTARNQR